MRFGMMSCHSCGKMCDPEHGRIRTVEVESGRSSGTVSVGGRGSHWTNNKGGSGQRRGSGIRYTTGRTYYKNVEVFVCDSCLQNEKSQRESDQKIKNVFYLILAAGMALFWLTHL
jgi:hypothetical protein